MLPPVSVARVTTNPGCMAHADEQGHRHHDMVGARVNAELALGAGMSSAYSDEQACVPSDTA
jgi:hypothetical protein